MIEDAIEDPIEPKRLIFPGLAGLYQRFSPLSYAFMRFSTGAVLVPHGFDKLISGSTDAASRGIAQHGLPFALVLAYLTVFTEFFAAGFLAIGLFTRAAAVMIWIEMSVIITLYLWPNGYFWTNKGYEYALLWWLLCVAIFFRGGGRYSLDHYLGREI